MFQQSFVLEEKVEERRRIFIAIFIVDALLLYVCWFVNISPDKKGQLCFWFSYRILDFPVCILDLIKLKPVCGFSDVLKQLFLRGKLSTIFTFFTFLLTVFTVQQDRKVSSLIIRLHFSILRLKFCIRIPYFSII